MNRLVDWAVSNTRLVLSMLAVVIIGGVVAYINIPKEGSPDIPIPYVYVQVFYPGISPEDSERLLVRPMETYLRTVQGVKNVTAFAEQSSASVILEFDVNFNKQKALEDVRAAVDLARGEMPVLPVQPVVMEFNTALEPIIRVSLSGDVPERTLLHLARQLRDSIQSIPGVLEADITGSRDEMLEIVINPAKLESYGITQQEMFSAVQQNNQLIAAGAVDTGHGSFAVKVPGVFQTAQDVLKLPIRASGNATVTLSDIADVHRTFYDATTFARLNGHRTIALDVSKRIGENIIDTVKKVRAVVADASKAWPSEVKVNYLFDQSKYTYDSLNSLRDSIVLAILLVMIVIVAALGLRSGIFVGIAIPTSFLMGFLLLDFTGLTVNEMTLFALLLAVGILIDGAIIVVEYADRKMGEGEPPKQAFANAAKRMFWPVTSATATMIAVFLPMLLWPGIVGKFMSYFPLTLIFVLGASLIVALIFLPVLGGIFGKAPPFDPEHAKALEASETGDWHIIPGITGAYARLCERLVEKPGRVVGGAIGIIFAVIVIFTFFNKGVEFFVTTDPTDVTVFVQARGNLAAQEKRDLLIRVENLIRPVKGVTDVFDRTIVSSRSLSNNGGVPVDTIARMAVEFDEDTSARPTGKAIAEEIRKRVATLPGLHVEVREPQSGIGSGKDIMIDAASNDYVALETVTNALRKHMDGVSTLRDIEDTRALPGIEWALDINREMASRFGADVSSVGTAVQLVTSGILIGRYRPDDSEQQVDIRVRYPLASRGLGQLDEVRVPTKNGMVPISSFVERKPRQQVNSIERVNATRVYHVRANVKQGVLVTAEVAKVQDWIKQQNLPDNVQIKFRGSAEQQDESGQFLLVATFMAFFLIAIILLAMFNSFYHAFLILMAVVFAMIGALLGMVLMGQTFSIIMSGTGLLALAGIVVNHNIVLIDTYHRLVAAGMNPIEAVIRSGAQRLRPVFLTTATAVLGLFPMMTMIQINFFTAHISFGGADAATWVQLSTSIIFGLAFSKMITLGLTPAMLALPYRMRERGHGLRWVVGRIWAGITWPVRIIFRGARRLTGRRLGAQPAE